MQDEKEILRVIERHKAFWEMEEVKKPLMSLGRYNPLRRSGPLEEAVYITPNEIGAQRYVGDGPASAVSGDFMHGAGPPGFCWMEAIMGCRILISVGSVWSEPFLNDWNDLEAIKPSQDNPWLAKLLEITRLLAEKAEGRYPITQPLFRGPIDMAAAVLGDERTCFAVYDSPNEFRRLLEICTDTFIEVAKARLELSPLFYGGYLSGYSIWAPGTVIRTQADNSALLSPSTYKEFLLPCDEQIFDSFDYPLIHLHSGCLHTVDVLLEAEKLRAIQVSLDYPAGLSAAESLPILKKINERKPLILTGPVTESELNQLLETLSPRGLCLMLSVRHEDD
ncbi:TPA: hypothetical protein EYP66_04565 [Candidatus Poribacteria bacterium]|nr:hypothetical protein [Candidatus Poribacteria bacterium]